MSTVTDALRRLEHHLLRAGQETALRNAWVALQEDRERAAARRAADLTLPAVPVPGQVAHRRPHGTPGHQGP